MAEGDLSASYARSMGEQSDKLPPAYRDAADAILVSAAQAGADLQDLYALIAEMQARAAQDAPPCFRWTHGARSTWQRAEPRQHDLWVQSCCGLCRARASDSANGGCHPLHAKAPPNAVGCLP